MKLEKATCYKIKRYLIVEPRSCNISEKFMAKNFLFKCFLFIRILYPNKQITRLYLEFLL